LKQLFRHAHANVPFHRQKFDRLGLAPGAFRGLDDLHRIPIANKSDITAQEHEALISETVNPENLILHCTSGTSGRPLRIYRSWHEERMLQQLRWKVYLTYGWRPTMKRAKMDIPPRKNPGRILQALNRFGLMRSRPFRSTAPAEELIQGIADYGPDILSGYPEGIAALARACRESEGGQISPRHVCSGGGQLTQLARAQILEAFPSAPVYDVYGSTEFNLLAWQCPETDYFHVSEEGMILEVLDEDGCPVPEGARGQVVGTALHSFAMPLLRMPVGDMAVRGPEACPCGAGFATLGAISGRLSDLFTLSGGRTLHPFLVLDPLDTMKAEWLRRYRLVQTARDHLVLELVARPQPADREVSELQASLSALIPNDIRLDIRFVERMPQESSGKFRLSVPLTDP